MDPLATEALDDLTAAITALLPPAVPPAPAPLLEILPLRIGGTGLGGLVGMSREPLGEIFGRRVEASARIRVRAATADALPEAVRVVALAFLAADRATLRGRGILRLDLDDSGPPAGAGEAQRELRFKVLYEFLKRPVDGGETIARIPVEIELARGVPPRPVFAAELGPASFPQLEAVDDPLATLRGPSDWHADPEPRIAQTSGISSASVAENPNKPGTYLVLRTAPGRPAVADFRLLATLRSGGPGGIGLVFRWQDVDNFYFFLMNTDDERNYRLLGRKVGGVFQPLDIPALDRARGFEPGRLYDLRLAAEGPSFTVELDGERILEGRDTALPAAGRVGLFSRNNRQSFFYRIDLVQL
jgi:hypothetical protein